MLVLFLNNLLPIFLAAGAGFLLSRRMQLHPRTVSQVVFYIFSPCLVFTLLTQNQLSDGDLVRMMAFALVIVTLIGVLTWLLGRLLKLERPILAAVLLSTMFMNSGNYGMPVTLFAFGELALAYASLFFVTIAMLSYSLGVVIASLGTRSLLQSLTNLLKIPTLYALLLALLFLRTGWMVPTFVERTTTLLGQASIPGMLVLLGLQFRRVDWRGYLKPLALANGVRLVASPLIALALSRLINLPIPGQQAAIVEAAMPTAVLTTVLATEFDAEPPLVTAVVFSSTLLSSFTLLPILSYLGA